MLQHSDIFQASLKNVTEFLLNVLVFNVKERTKAETLNSRLKQQLTDYKVPDVSYGSYMIVQSSLN